MSLLHAIVLGIVQGLSEFIPISSSGHLAIVPWLFGWDDFAGDDSLAKAFDVALHIGTLAGAIAYFWRDLVVFAREGLRVVVPANRADAPPEGRIAWLLVVSAVPAAITGFLLNDAIEELDDIYWLIGVMLIVGGVLLWAADRMGGPRKAGEFRLRDALLMGLGQAAALQPGVSRSGVTITVSRALGFDRAAAARLSFLMSLPIIAGAGVYKLLDVVGEGGIPSDFVAPFLVGMATSAVTGFAAVWGTIRFVQTRTFAPFVGYRFVVGAGVIALAVAGFNS
ncbi:undecaprenyl-diphosphate phosphatase [Acidimicrobiia bacterium EGI L10123]|uniref:undecaprenyl-diphosphate phosphatase n=1 Tax=Salinilacustrithrix flava TaxID=2957203 RepID=UPI003D7C1ADF|nr:undecaprenyl-diphosphate phosphatase [Acidimicrobiia bacterium EGI L10123]